MESNKRLTELEFELDRYGEATQQLDRYVIQLSAGSLALSVTFSETIGAKQTWVIITAWVLFIAAIIATIGSYAIMSQWRLRKIRSIAEGSSAPSSKTIRFVGFLNAAGHTFFIAGLAFLAAFGIVNLA